MKIHSGYIALSIWELGLRAFANRFMKKSVTNRWDCSYSCEAQIPGGFSTRRGFLHFANLNINLKFHLCYKSLSGKEIQPFALLASHASSSFNIATGTHWSKKYEFLFSSKEVYDGALRGKSSNIFSTKSGQSRFHGEKKKPLLILTLKARAPFSS